jgi:hypothetical protein
MADERGVEAPDGALNRTFATTMVAAVLFCSALFFILF